MTRTRVLEKELKTFENRRRQLVKEARGKYALIYGESLVGVFPSLKESFVAGYSELGNVPFLVKEINEEDPIYFVG